MSKLTHAIHRFDIEKYLETHGARHESAHEWALACPVCCKDKLIVNALKKAWHCWYCQDRTSTGRGGLLALVQLLDNLDKSQAVRRILQGAHDHVEVNRIEEQKVLAEVASDVIAIPPPPNWRYGAVDYTGILPYCHRRGIEYQDIVNFGLLWCDGGRYRNRLIFPVWERGNLVYWQARAMWEEQESRGRRYVKALNPPKTPGALGATDVLMNLDQAARYDRVVVTEGPIDCVHVGPEAVCTFGKKISPIQIHKLRQAGVKALDVMWDGPSSREPRGAWPEMFKEAPRLGLLFDIRLVFLPKGDPGDYSRADLREIRKRCSRKFSEYLAIKEI